MFAYLDHPQNGGVCTDPAADAYVCGCAAGYRYTCRSADTPSLIPNVLFGKCSWNTSRSERGAWGARGADEQLCAEVRRVCEAETCRLRVCLRALFLLECALCWRADRSFCRRRRRRHDLHAATVLPPALMQPSCSRSRLPAADSALIGTVQPRQLHGRRERVRVPPVPGSPSPN